DLGHPGESEPDPVQRLARRAVRMLDRRDDRDIRRDPERGRLFLAGAHAARARHHGGLRPAQERVGAPQAGAAGRGGGFAGVLTSAHIPFTASHSAAVMAGWASPRPAARSRASRARVASAGWLARIDSLLSSPLAMSRSKNAAKPAGEMRARP